MAKGYSIEHCGIVVLEIFFIIITKQPMTDFYLFGEKCQKGCESGDQEARKGQGCGGHLFNKEPCLLQQHWPKFFIPDKEAGQRIHGVGKSQQCEPRVSKGDSSPSGCSGFTSALRHPVCSKEPAEAAGGVPLGHANTHC